jgi:hypothetical protein
MSDILNDIKFDLVEGRKMDLEGGHQIFDLGLPVKQRVEIATFITDMINELKAKDYKTVNYTYVVLRVMQFCETKWKKGIDKRIISDYIIGDVMSRVSHTGLSDKDLLNETIDLIIGLSKGHYDINRTRKCVGSCLPKIFSRRKLDNQ